MSIHINTEPAEAEVILAAGGVIERQVQGGIKIAVIRRERYGTEWCLPKGKVNEGETLTQAAHREIKEETGCEVELVRFLATDSYSTEDNIKSVFYWLCHPTSECQFDNVDDEEAKELLWLSPEEAISRLTHNSQQNLVRNAYSLDQKKPYTFLQKLSYLYSRYLQAKRWKRLASEITTYRTEYRSELASMKALNTDWEAGIRTLLDQSESALMEGDIDKGWKCLLAAKRIALLPIRDEKLLKAKAEQLHVEAEKLNKWRRKAVNNLLSKHIPPKKLTPNILFDAALIRDEHYNNQAYKDGLRRVYHMFLGILLFLHLGLILYFVSIGVIKFDKDAIGDHSSMLIGVVIFGLLGAIFSAIITSFNIDVSTRIPETALAIRVTILRIVLGAGSAVILYLILISPLMGLIDTEVFDITDTTPILIFVLAIAAGFSERLVLSALEKVSKK